MLLIIIVKTSTISESSKKGQAYGRSLLFLFSDKKILAMHAMALYTSWFL